MAEPSSLIIICNNSSSGSEHSSRPSERHAYLACEKVMLVMACGSLGSPAPAMQSSLLPLVLRTQLPSAGSQQPLALEEFLALARGAGYDLNEQDVLAAQAREDSLRSDAELQASAGQEARRLRSFIPG